MSDAQDWSWVDEDMYQEKLRSMLEEMSALDLLNTVPGMMDEVREVLHNDILEELADEHGRNRYSGKVEEDE